MYEVCTQGLLHAYVVVYVHIWNAVLCWLMINNPHLFTIILVTITGVNKCIGVLQKFV